MSLRIDDFRAQLTGGGARPNRFQVIGGFPSGASGLINAAAGLASATGLISSNASNAISSVTNALTGGSPARQLSFLCKAATIPGGTLGTIPIPFRGRQLKLPGDRTYQPWTIQVINDTSFRLRHEFEKWQNQINDAVNNVGVPGLGTAQDWKVQQLGTNNEVLATYRLVGCWPQDVSPINLDYNQSDTIEEYTVTLEYQYWVPEGSPGVGGVLNALASTF